MGNSGKKEVNLFVNTSRFGSGNPFNADGASSFDGVKDVSKPVKRLNGYDSAILNKTAFDEAQERELSVDFRIKEKETLIKDLNAKIKMADDYGNINEALGLKAKRQRLMQELSALKRNQADSVVSDVYSRGIKSIPVIRKVRNFVSRHVLAKVSKKINSIVALSDSLEQLSNISKNVDELIDMNTPYGEKIQNYEKLTEYLNKANKIHSNISKSIGRTV